MSHFATPNALAAAARKRETQAALDAAQLRVSALARELGAARHLCNLATKAHQSAVRDWLALVETPDQPVVPLIDETGELIDAWDAHATPPALVDWARRWQPPQ